MVTPTCVVTAQGSVRDVKTTPGLATTPQGTDAVGVVVVVLVGEDVGLVIVVLVADVVEGVEVPPDGDDEVLHDANSPPSVRVISLRGRRRRMMAGAPTFRVSHSGRPGLRRRAHVADEGRLAQLRAKDAGRERSWTRRNRGPETTKAPEAGPGPMSDRAWAGGAVLGSPRREGGLACGVPTTMPIRPEGRMTTG